MSSQRFQGMMSSERSGGIEEEEEEEISLNAFPHPSKLELGIG